MAATRAQILTQIATEFIMLHRFSRDLLAYHNLALSKRYISNKETPCSLRHGLSIRSTVVTQDHVFYTEVCLRFGFH